ncbi:IclR family transcriptional regulator [Xenophilus azovorans]|uniref:IclR family transcriptional regulator n=1 Tax=Xenophilus azovorans TaxID=151755 RepID=UPI00068FB7DE|nr:IclR family transcriptional regulator [Xenophilus azovorans]
MTSRTHAADGAQSLHRAIGLLRLLSARTATGWRLSDLAQEAALEHSTVHRMLGCLLHERLAVRVAGTRRYTLGPLAYELGVAAAPHFAIERLAGPALAQLAAETRDIVFLNVRSGAESVCVARFEGRKALKAYTVEVGTRRPLSLSAGGAAMLIALPRAEQSRIQALNLRAIVRRGEAQQTAVRRMLQRSRRLGYGCNQEDIIPGIAAIGVAIRSAAGEPLASLSLAAAGADLAPPRRSRLLERLNAEARKIGAQLELLRY